MNNQNCQSNNNINNLQANIFCRHVDFQKGTRVPACTCSFSANRRHTGSVWDCGGPLSRTCSAKKSAEWKLSRFQGAEFTDSYEMGEIYLWPQSTSIAQAHAKLSRWRQSGQMRNWIDLDRLSIRRPTKWELQTEEQCQGQESRRARELLLILKHCLIKKAKPWKPGMVISHLSGLSADVKSGKAMALACSCYLVLE